MAHRTLPIFGVQFHPEGVATDLGKRLMANFLTLAGIGVAGPAGLARHG